MQTFIVTIDGTSSSNYSFRFWFGFTFGSDIYSVLFSSKPLCSGDEDSDSDYGDDDEYSDTDSYKVAIEAEMTEHLDKVMLEARARYTVDSSEIDTVWDPDATMKLIRADYDEGTTNPVRWLARYLKAVKVPIVTYLPPLSISLLPSSISPLLSSFLPYSSLCFSLYLLPSLLLFVYVDL